MINVSKERPTNLVLPNAPKQGSSADSMKMQTPQKPMGKRKMKPKLLLSVIIPMVLVIGTVAALVLVKIAQDIRQQAAITYPGVCMPISSGCSASQQPGSNSDCDSCDPQSEVCCVPLPTQPAVTTGVYFRF